MIPFCVSGHSGKPNRNSFFRLQALREAKSQFVFASPDTSGSKIVIHFGLSEAPGSEIVIHFGLPETPGSEIAIHFWLSEAPEMQIAIHFWLPEASEMQIAIHFGLHGHSEHTHRRSFYASLIISSLRIIFVSPINETKELSKVSHLGYPAQMVTRLSHSF